MTSVVGITALQELRKFKGFESAIIAGGFVRDSILGGSIKDLDIFVPCQSLGEFKNIVEQHFQYGIEDKPNPVQHKIPESEFDAWLNDQERQGIDPWKKFVFDFNNEHRIYMADERWDGRPQKKMVTSDIGNFKNLVYNQNGYRQISPNYLGRYDCNFMGFLDVDIVGYFSKQVNLKDFEGRYVGDFGKELVGEFSYNIDKVYFDGENTIETPEFSRDRKHNEATLVRLDSLMSLPHAMRKFERLREKYPKLVFRSTVLEVKKEEDNSHKKEAYKSKYYNSSTTAAGLNPWAIGNGVL